MAAIREVIAGIDLGGAIAAGSKPFLNLGLGDPSVYGNFPPAEAALDAIHHSLRSGKSDGYPASVGYAATRQAVADYFNIGEHDSIKKEDIIMTRLSFTSLGQPRWNSPFYDFARRCFGCSGECDFRAR